MRNRSAAVGMARGVLRVVVLGGVATPAIAGEVFETVYADPLATGANDGSSWADAYTSLSDALAAVTDHDMLYTRGTFHERASIEAAWDWTWVTWIGDSDPERPTWIRADRAITAWVTDAQSAVGGVMVDVAGLDEYPVSVTWDWQQDVDGSVTGIAGAWHGHLREAASLTDVRSTPGTWYFDAPADLLHVSPPAGEAWDESRARWCAHGSGVILRDAGETTIAGVNTMLWCDPEPTVGYGLRGATCFGCTFERSTVVDSGYHVAGFVGQGCYRNTLRDITGWGQWAIAQGEPVKAIAYVFYTNESNPESRCLAERLTFHAYPRLGVDGAPLVEAYECSLGYSHTSLSGPMGEVFLGDLEWRDCVLRSRERDLNIAHGLQMAWTGDFIDAANAPRFFDDLVAEEYPIRVVGGSAHARAPALGPFIHAQNVTLDSTGFADVAPQVAVRAKLLGFNERLYMTGCVIHFDSGDKGSYRFYDLTSTSKLRMDLCTLHSAYTGILPHRSIFFRFSSQTASLRCRKTVFSRAAPGDLFFTTPGGMTTDSLHLEACWIDGIVDNGYGYGNPTDQDDFAWFESTFLELPGTLVDVDPELAIDEQGALRPIPDGALARTRFPIGGLQGIVDVEGTPYNGGYGARQPAPGDTDGDRDCDLDDLNSVLGRWGWVAEPTDATDLNGSGVIDLDDLNVILGAFGTSN